MKKFIIHTTSPIKVVQHALRSAQLAQTSNDEITALMHQNTQIADVIHALSEEWIAARSICIAA